MTSQLNIILRAISRWRGDCLGVQGNSPFL